MSAMSRKVLVLRDETHCAISSRSHSASFFFIFVFSSVIFFMYAYGIHELRLSAAPPCKGAFPGGAGVLIRAFLCSRGLSECSFSLPAFQGRRVLTRSCPFRFR